MKTETLASSESSGIEFARGQSVIFQGRASTVEEVGRRGDIITVSNYAGRFMVGRTHPELRPAGR